MSEYTPQSILAGIFSVLVSLMGLVLLAFVSGAMISLMIKAFLYGYHLW